MKTSLLASIATHYDGIFLSVVCVACSVRVYFELKLSVNLKEVSNLETKVIIRFLFLRFKTVDSLRNLLVSNPFRQKGVH